MNNSLKKHREEIAIAGYLAIIFVLVYFVIIPLLANIGNANYQIQEEKMKQEIVRQHINELPKIQKQYESLENSLDLTLVLLDENEAVALIESLEKVARETENIIRIEVQKSADQKKVVAKSKSATEVAITDELSSNNYLQLKITLEGEYSNIVNLIKAIENFEYYSDIVQVQIDKIDPIFESQSRTANPFSANSSNGEEKKAVSKPGALTATLDVIFYKK